MWTHTTHSGVGGSPGHQVHLVVDFHHALQEGIWQAQATKGRQDTGLLQLRLGVAHISDMDDQILRTKWARWSALGARGSYSQPQRTPSPRTLLIQVEGRAPHHGGLTSRGGCNLTPQSGSVVNIPQPPH